jgi:hypothetical protein
MPARAAMRMPMLGAALRRIARDLAHEGSLARTRGRVRLELVADELLAAPELERAVDRALANPGLERLVTRVLESRLVDHLTDQVLRSPGMDRVVEQIATSRSNRLPDNENVGA